jgi:hypothetical protein
MKNSRFEGAIVAFAVVFCIAAIWVPIIFCGN